MKLPSLFRVNRPNRFSISPRHYDPVKEEIENRTERIKRELEAEGLLDAENKDNKESGIRHQYGSSIRGAFTQGSPINRKPSTIFESAGILRLIIFLVLIGGFGGYLYIGPEVLYYFLYLGVGMALLALFYRLKKKTKK